MNFTQKFREVKITTIVTTINIDGSLSEPHSVNSGVPQGSVISPILFIFQYLLFR